MLFQRYVMVYKSHAGTPVFLTGLGAEALRVIRAAQEALQSTDFEVARQRRHWDSVSLAAFFERPSHPLWAECIAFIEYNRRG